MSLKKLLSVVFIGMLTLAALGCEQEGPVEEAGEQVDETMEQTGEQMEETGEQVRE